MGPVGVQEMVVIFLVAMLLFGPKKLPELARSIGKAITEFRRAQSELKATFEGHMRELEKENESIKEITRSYTNEIYNSVSDYDSSFSDSITYHAEPQPAIAANPSTVSASAPQGAESSVSIEAPANETVPRNAASEADHQPAASQPATPEHSLNS
jgi:TatA/E family protein of Tat protein translocase